MRDLSIERLLPDAPPVIRAVLSRFCDQMAAAGAEHLDSLALFGDGPRGQWLSPFATPRLLCLVQGQATDALERYCSPLLAVRQAIRAKPTVMTTHEWRRVPVVSPMLHFELSRGIVVLLGRDLLIPPLDNGLLALQVERLALHALMGLRRIQLLQASAPTRLQHELIKIARPLPLWVDACVALRGGMSRVENIAWSASLNRAEELGIDPNAWRRLELLARERERVARLREVIDDAMTTMERIAHHARARGHGSHAPADERSNT